ncbi:hypothetical protein DAMNIGENAA_15310 [Desulforhabdus amnigena]|uniref:Uncharacterized protein n=1 Tax=Desulforhabdus amnigena TaxID=40218 RepID=A0A9W6FSI8_9BACT|nr:hypothetical protein DAMNIGENAA_15310 [Desulforhabdus amnigena]
MFAKFGILSRTLPIDMAPAVLVPTPERLIQRGRIEKLFFADTADPGWNDRHSQRDFIAAEQTTQDFEWLASCADVISPEKYLGHLIPAPLLDGCSQMISPTMGRVLPKGGKMAGTVIFGQTKAV